MRGKGHKWRRCCVSAGITPAYAGKRHLFQGHELDKEGSPPPMRGKVFRVLFAVQAVGITPAYAGKSQTLWISDRSQEDHPRLCGEKPPNASRTAQRGGSPPPMRGKDNADANFSNGYRITPAYAGKRSCLCKRDSPP